MGLNAIKWELEDLSFKTLYPKIYQEIVDVVADRAPERDKYLEQVRVEIDKDLKSMKIKAEITGRPKHYYSVYQKMIVRGRDLGDIYDLVGVRILVDSVRDCYAVLGAMHARYQPVPGRFKDYIAMPKFNLYQSLHTTVIGPTGKPVELQIRTWDMHRRAEYGLAAHWRYKDAARGGADRERGHNRHGVAAPDRGLAARDGGSQRVPRFAAWRDWARARSTSSRRAASCLRCRMAPRPSTSRTQCTRRWGTRPSVLA